MQQHTSHNIICLEAEWEYSEQNPIADSGSGVKLTVCLPITAGIRTAAGVVHAVRLVPVVVIFAVMFFSLGKNA